MKNKLKIVFFEVKKKQEKLIKILLAAKYHFENKKKLIFLVSDDKAQNFLDDFLWKEPKISFLPHSIDGDDLITISQKNKEANYIFNLTAYPIYKIPFKAIYEFDDYTDKKKLLISKKKFKFYKEKRFLIEARK